jgi:hypothetical protein
MHDFDSAGHIAQVAKRRTAKFRPHKLWHIFVWRIIERSNEPTVDANSEQQRGHALSHGPAGEAHIRRPGVPVVLREDSVSARHEEAGDLDEGGTEW